MPFRSLSAAAIVYGSCQRLMTEHALLTAEIAVLWGINEPLCDKSHGRKLHLVRQKLTINLAFAVFFLVFYAN